MLNPFINKPKIYNQKLLDYANEANHKYLIKLSELYENNKKNSVLNSAITIFHKQNDKLSNTYVGSITSITSILLASTFIFYFYNLRK